VQVAAMKSMISGRTVMLVGSAPQFPHGAIDDIVGIAGLGERYGIPVHVDSCLGGFLIPFMEEAGFPLPLFDFRLPGVTSISADTHKYGFAPKGSSVVLYREQRFRNYQWFCCPDWPGGIYATPTIGGSRAGGIVAACWAALLYFGRDGYVATTREIITTTRRIAAAVRAINGLEVVGSPDVSVIAFDSPNFNIYALNDGMKGRGWALNALQFPSCLHLCVTRLHTVAGVADRFIKDLQEVTELMLADPAAADKSDSAIL
jgi:sphinganine-1-phosphate aldolase